VRPSGAKPTFQSYVEADSVLIAEKIVAMGQLSPPSFSHSASWLAFLKKVEQL
jgi:hypothetical protein